MIRLDLVRRDLDTMRDALRLERVDRLRTGEPALSPAAKRWLREQTKLLEGFVENATGGGCDAAH